LPAEVEIRDARPGDAERIAEISIEGWAREIRSNLARLTEGSFSLVGLTGAEIAGSCFVVSPPRDEDLGPEVAELVAIYVHPEHWRAGVGGALLDAAQARAARLGSTEMSLWTLTENGPAQVLYERHGWRCDGAEQVHPIAETPAIRMRHPLL
jgi:GNAT superfamily N-acetyltransferase